MLGVIPRMRTLRPEIVSLQKPASITAEAYRQLRTAVYFVGIDRGGCFEVTSAKGKEGKTLTATNLAVAAARAGRRVYLVDCDLRQPAVHKYLGLPNDSGFTSVLLGTPVSRAGQSIPGVENLTVLTSGPLPPNPSELLGGDRCREVLRSLEADGALVVIDTAPLLPVTDAAALSRSVDAVILVSRAKTSTKRQTRSALEVLRQVDAPIVGSVLNGLREEASGHYYRIGHRGRRWEFPRWGSKNGNGIARVNDRARRRRLTEPRAQHGVGDASRFRSRALASRALASRRRRRRSPASRRHGGVPPRSSGRRPACSDGARGTGGAR